VLSEDDVMQQTFADAIRGIERFVPLANGSFRGWLATLARRNLADTVEMLNTGKRGGSHRQIRMVRKGDSWVTLLHELTGGDKSPSANLIHEEVMAALSKAVEELPTAYRIVVERCDLHGESPAAVAKALNRSRGAVYMLRARAHDRLREMLGATGGFFTTSA
jgi:RNA polymerase sigma factor (sigma-70 family)